MTHGVRCEGSIGRGYVQRRGYEIGRGPIVVNLTVKTVMVHSKEVTLAKDEATSVTPEAIDVKKELLGFHD